MRRRDEVILLESDSLTRVTTRSSYFRRACFKLALITLGACAVSATRSSLEETSRQVWLLHAANFSNSDDFGVLWKSYN